MPRSPPETPATTRSFTTKGADVFPMLRLSRDTGGDFDIPEQLSRYAVKRQQMRIVCHEEDAIAEYCYAAIRAFCGITARLARAGRL